MNPTPSLADALARSAGSIEMCLELLLPLSAGPEARLLTAMRYAVLGGGKRLRGFLVMEGASLFGVSETCAARVAASVEMLHAYSLVHDDLPAMDDDDLRRGKPSSHKAFDEATAILAATRCRPARSRCWPSRTPIRTRRRAASWWPPSAPPRARAAWRAAR